MKHPPVTGHGMKAFPWQHDEVGVMAAPLQSSLTEQQ